MRARVVALGFAWVIVTSGCSAKKSEVIGVAASASAPPAVSARRPTKHYFLERTTERCEIYSLDGSDKSEPFKTSCPQELEVGERFRVAGRTCTRESNEAARQVPVVCPDPLTNFEKHDRQVAPSTSAETR